MQPGTMWSHCSVKNGQGAAGSPPYVGNEIAPSLSPGPDRFDGPKFEIRDRIDRRVVSVPLPWFRRLSEATPAQRAYYTLIGDGQGALARHRRGLERRGDVAWGPGSPVPRWSGETGRCVPPCNGPEHPRHPAVVRWAGIGLLNEFHGESPARSRLPARNQIARAEAATRYLR
jgi:hypothetical protein